MAPKALYHKRAFLNSSREVYGGGAYVLAHVEREEWAATGKRKASWYVGADFRVADCNRYVDLEFGASTVPDLRRRVRKADLLLNTLLDFRNTLVDELERCESKP